MKIRFCSCGQCRVALRCKNVSDLMRVLVRAERRKAKAAIRKGEEPRRDWSAPRCG
jgi:Iap family predicted aminopeptidase